MKQFIKSDKRARHKKSKSLKSNIATHPFVLATIIAAVAIVVWTIIFNWFKLGF